MTMLVNLAPNSERYTTLCQTPFCVFNIHLVGMALYPLNAHLMPTVAPCWHNTSIFLPLRQGIQPVFTLPFDSQ
jgi:hypothetical protein